MNDDHYDQVVSEWRTYSAKALEALRAFKSGEAVEYAKSALIIALNQDVCRGEKTVVSHSNLAAAFVQLGDSIAAEKEYLAAISHAKESVQHNAPVLGDLYVSFGQFLHNNGKSRLAIEYLEGGIRLIVGRFDEESLKSQALAFFTLGHSCRDSNQLASAENWYRAAISILERPTSVPALEVCNVYASLADLQARSGDKAAAYLSVSTALKRAFSQVHDEHPIIAQLLNASAKVHYRFENYEKAIDDLTTAYSLWCHLELSKSSECLQTLIDLASIQIEVGKLQDANVALTQVLTTLKEMGRELSPIAAAAWRGRSRIAREMQNPELELACAQTVCTIIREAVGPNAPCLVGDFTAVGDVALRLSPPKLQLALDSYNEAFDLAKSLRGESDVALLPPLVGLACTFERLGDQNSRGAILNEIRRVRQVIQK